MSLKGICVMMGLALSICLAGKDTLAQKAPEKNIKKILGTWKIQKIYSGKTEVAKNPTSGQWIEFRPDGKYVQNLTSADSGSYRMNENESVLYLESAVHAGAAKSENKSIIEWEIAFADGALTMQQNLKDNKPHGDNMKYVYTRIEQVQKAQKN